MSCTSYFPYINHRPYFNYVYCIPEAFHLNSNLRKCFRSHSVETAQTIFHFDNRILNENECRCIPFGFRHYTVGMKQQKSTSMIEAMQTQKRPTFSYIPSFPQKADYLRADSCPNSHVPITHAFREKEKRSAVARLMY